LLSAKTKSHPLGGFLFFYKKGFEQGGRSEATEENSSVNCFRRRGKERSSAIGAAALGQNPLLSAISTLKSLYIKAFRAFLWYIFV